MLFPMRANPHFSFLCLTLLLGLVVSHPAEAKKAVDPLEGLTVNVFGDSYVANHRRPKEETWHFKLAEKHQMTYRNYGRNGSSVAFDRTQSGFGPSMTVRYADMDPQADLILLIAGHNDASMIASSLDSLELFRDSLDLLFCRLEAKYPQAKIAYVGPWYLSKDGFEQTVKVIRQVCRRHHIPFLDNYSPKCVIKVRDDEFRKVYFQNQRDTAHLNAQGHDLYLPVAEKFLLKVARKK